MTHSDGEDLLTDIICVTPTVEFLKHRPKTNWDSLSGSRPFKILVSLHLIYSILHHSIFNYFIYIDKKIIVF